ncbi:MAG: hypothetical protein ABF380_07155 [Akkermansiaceae bacterium]|jgi:hypothetical protein
MPDDQSVNPYAAPGTLSHEKMGFAGFEVRGKKLAVQDGAILPARCIKTNQDVTPGENGRLKRIKLNWTNPWWILLILLPIGILIYIIVALSTQKKGSITISLSSEAMKRKRVWLISLFSLAFGIPALLFGLRIESAELIGFAVFGSILLLIAGLFTIRYLTPVKYIDGWFLIRGVHKEFLNDLASGKIWRDGAIAADHRSEH